MGEVRRVVKVPVDLWSALDRAKVGMPGDAGWVR
jgi:hypothetical protein